MCYTFEKLRPIRGEWEALAERTADIMATFDWYEAWWQQFGRRRTLQIHTLQEGERLVGVLPLFRETIRPGGVFLRTVRVVGCDYLSGAVGLPIEPEHAGRFIRLVVDRLSAEGPWDILQIGPLRSYVVINEAMAEAAAGNWHVGTVILGREDNWSTLFDLPATYDEFEGSLPGKSRTEIRRRERQFREKHRVEVEVVREAGGGTGGSRQVDRAAPEALDEQGRARAVRRGG